jgi:hypothetical protein
VYSGVVGEGGASQVLLARSDRTMRRWDEAGSMRAAESIQIWALGLPAEAIDG